MVETTRALMTETCALLGYTQSDEISLCWYSDSLKSQVYFDGRVQKMVGDLAAFASLVFNELLVDGLPEKAGQRARFDARVWTVPNLQEVANTFLWRELDATKNSVSMAASHYYSHRELQNKHGGEMQDMLHAKGINWNDYPAFFKRGTFLQRRLVAKPFTSEELERLPEKHEARRNPDLVVERQVVVEVDMPPFSKVTNRVDVLLGALPLTDEDT
jgi:tRNA(His) 5'-end guanylyltransferase